MRTERLPLKNPVILLTALCLLGPGWDVFQKPDPDVKRGNSLIAKGKAKEALEAYKEAEKRIGRRPRLDYNQGLALFALEKYEKAREAFLVSAGATDESLRRRALYNLANTLYRLAEPSLKEAGKARRDIESARRKIQELEGAEKQQARCQAMGATLKAYPDAIEKQAAVVKAFDSSYKEYRQVLIRDPDHFKAKWNLELSLRHMAAARKESSKLEKEQAALQERFEKECKPPEDQKKDQKKKDQDKDKKKQKDQDKKKDQDKDKKKQKDQDKKKDQKRNREKDQKKDQKKQKPMTKKDIARKKAAQALDRLEQRQRERDRERARSGATRQPAKDW